MALERALDVLGLCEASFASSQSETLFCKYQVAPIPSSTCMPSGRSGFGWDAISINFALSRSALAVSTGPKTLARKALRLVLVREDLELLAIWDIEWCLAKIPDRETSVASRSRRGGKVLVEAHQRRGPRRTSDFICVSPRRRSHPPLLSPLLNRLSLTSCMLGRVFCRTTC